MRETFGVSGVRTIEDVERLQARVRSDGRARAALRRRVSSEQGRGRDREEARLVLAGDGVDEEVVGLDGERLLDLELVRRVVHDEVEPPEDCHKCDLDLLPRERTALYDMRISALPIVLF